MMSSLGGAATLALVALGGAMGAVLRFVLVGAMARLSDGLSGFPIGVLTANVVGSLLIGVAAARLGAFEQGAGAALRLFLIPGLLGGFTTFSAFSLDTLGLIDKGRLGAATGYVLASVVLSLLAVWIGVRLVAALR